MEDKFTKVQFPPHHARAPIYIQESLKLPKPILLQINPPFYNLYPVRLQPPNLLGNTTPVSSDSPIGVDYFVARVEVKLGIRGQHARDGSWGSLKVFGEDAIGGNFPFRDALDGSVEIGTESSHRMKSKKEFL